MYKLNLFNDLEDLLYSIQSIEIIDGYEIGESVTFRFLFSKTLEYFELETKDLDNDKKFRAKYFELFKKPCPRFINQAAWDQFMTMICARADIVNIVDEAPNIYFAMLILDSIRGINKTRNILTAIDSIYISGQFYYITEKRVQDIIDDLQLPVTLNVIKHIFMKQGYIDTCTPFRYYLKERRKVWKLVSHKVFPVKTLAGLGEEEKRRRVRPWEL